MEDDEHFLTVCRYAERNALRAGLVRRAEDWRWCSLFRWQQGSAQEKSLLAAWPLPRRPGWIEHVNRPPSEAEPAAIRRCMQRGSPFGNPAWSDRIVRLLGLESTLRPRGRLQKRRNGS